MFLGLLYKLTKYGFHNFYDKLELAFALEEQIYDRMFSNPPNF